MQKANQDLRDRMEEKNVKYWQVALAYGVNDATFTKKLRVELDDNEKTKINAIIDNLVKENKK